jgi:hypothetical protein
MKGACRHIWLLPSYWLIDYQPMETTAAISDYYARGGEVHRLDLGRGDWSFCGLRMSFPRFDGAVVTCRRRVQA